MTQKRAGDCMKDHETLLTYQDPPTGHQLRPVMGSNPQLTACWRVLVGEMCIQALTPLESVVDVRHVRLWG